jgi:hypothetical protein
MHRHAQTRPQMRRLPAAGQGAAPAAGEGAAPALADCSLLSQCTQIALRMHACTHVCSSSWLVHLLLFPCAFASQCLLFSELAVQLLFSRLGVQLFIHQDCNIRQGDTGPYRAWARQRCMHGKQSLHVICAFGRACA